MSRAQSSIMSFFQPRQQPNYAPRPAPQPPAAVKAAQVAAAAAAAAQATQYGSEPPMTASASAAAPSPPPPTTTTTQPASSPHPQATIVPVAEHHIPALRRINSLLLPVNYPDSFYHKALDPAVSGLFSRVILWRDDDDDGGSNQQSQQQGGGEQRASDQVIGGIVCRLEPSPFSSAASPGEAQAIYIQSLALLSPYRGLGLAAAALDDILAAAAAAHTASPASRLDVRTAFAHVWTENEDGLAWYLARGFVREGPEPVRGYYFKLRPDTAWIVRREIPGPGPGPPARRPVPQPVVPRAAGTGTGLSATAAAANLPPIATSDGAVSGPPRKASASSGPPPSHSASPSPAPSLSFQNMRPETEWNDLPEHMVAQPGKSNGGGGGLQPPRSGSASGASSRSSSAVRKKKDRAYPAAAFGQ